jgi:hypothetical protein
MTISELIRELEKARDKYGDTSVNYDDGEGTVEIKSVHWSMGSLVVDSR